MMRTLLMEGRGLAIDELVAPLVPRFEEGDDDDDDVIEDDDDDCVIAEDEDADGINEEGDGEDSGEAERRWLSACSCRLLHSGQSGAARSLVDPDGT